MSATRKAAVAGAFYPGDADILKADVLALLKDAKHSYAKKPTAIVAPHAGYIYSGPIAAEAYVGLQTLKSEIETVVLLGPSHRIAFAGIAASTATEYETPLGKIPLHQDWNEELKNFKQIGFYDEAHRLEHSLEVHLPFLQETLGKFELVPLVVGDSDPTLVAEIIEHFLKKPKTLIVISSDLSHYHPYADARRIDSETAGLIENLDFQNLVPERACGARPLGGLLKLAKEKDFKVERIDLRNSGDTAGEKDQVVGYGAFAFYD